MVVETTNRKHAERMLARREREASFLAEASRVLAGSLDYRSTLETVARLAVPEIADWCVVDMLQEDGKIRRVALAHSDRTKEPLAWELTKRFPSGPAAFEGTPKAIRNSTREIIPEIRDSYLKRMAKDAEHLEALRSLGWRSLMIVPLRARGRTLGAIGFVSADSGRRYDRHDLDFAEDLADRCALAVDNARLFGEREAISQALQRSLLPPRMPEIPGVEVAARYRPAGAGDVGGDFYDVFPTADGRWGIAIGDVSGKGPDAAAITALARHTLHVAAAYEERPSRVLAALNDALLEDTPRPLLTAAYARLTPSQPASIELSVGGHPLPLIIRRDGIVEQAGEAGTILGFAAVPALHDSSHGLEPGDAIVFFTDGVIESRPISLALGEIGLAELLTEAGGCRFQHRRVGTDHRRFPHKAGRGAVSIRVQRRMRTPSRPEKPADRRTTSIGFPDLAHDGIEAAPAGTSDVAARSSRAETDHLPAFTPYCLRRSFHQAHADLTKEAAVISRDLQPGQICRTG